ncbi:MAG: RnfABCDGE type electron transport complex subunit B [Sulfuricaulis sp.]|uniref:RnfABCDGE type electron transport complex subunit B n=1 Tax=Sulfuricaulis sp. TaxID=2003553 RepID=UPI0025F9B4A1|nr:RnfABCDGE type electron transport complex subunit B [Sulfuricaulis sp.]MCR4348224.1 RnfABCDGE type electron transport complex subunit B [Sulfuricaulis sp.]
MPDMLPGAQAPHGPITDRLMVRRADSPGQSENQDRDGTVESVRAHHCRPRRTRRYCDAMPTSANAPLAPIERIDACLPQTQCTLCGYPHCRAYAETLAAGSAGLNQCPPGGDVTIRALSALLHAAPQPLDPRFGSHKPRARAVIDETLCIGCRRCIDACPVDAILGARKFMHTIIANECTGCELCLPPCPVDCIAMLPDLTEHARSASGSPPSPLRGRGNEGEGAPNDVIWPEYPHAETVRWRMRTEKRLGRLARNKYARRRKAVQTAGSMTPLPNNREKIRAEIRAAVERAKLKRKIRQG